MLSNLFGEKIDFEVTEESKKESISMMKDFFEVFSTIEQMKKDKVNPVECAKFFLNKIDSFFHWMISEIPESQHFVDWYINLFTESLKIDSHLLFLKETRFEHYQNMLKDLIMKIVDLGRLEKAKKFITEMRESEESLVIAQFFVIRFEKNYRYLDKKRKRITKKTIEKNIRIYRELAGLFEKYIVVLVGLIRILRKDELPVYSKLRAIPLGTKEKMLKEEADYSDYRDFVAPFNRTIRNALAHGSCYFQFFDKKIKFIDLKQNVVIQYEDFINQVRELSSLVLALSQIPFHILLFEYQNFKQILDEG